MRPVDISFLPGSGPFCSYVDHMMSATNKAAVSASKSSGSGLVLAPYPAKTANKVGPVRGIQTAVSSISFADQIVVTISQHGRLAHWVHVPLRNPLPDEYHASPADMPEGSTNELLPMPHLTATTVLGGTIPEIAIFGQLLASQIGSAILSKDKSESRLLVVGMGLQRGGVGPQEYADLVGLALEVL